MLEKSIRKVFYAEVLKFLASEHLYILKNYIDIVCTDLC